MVDGGDDRLSLLLGEQPVRLALVHRISGVRVKAVQYQDAAESVFRAECVVELNQLPSHSGVDRRFRGSTLRLCESPVPARR